MVHNQAIRSSFFWGREGRTSWSSSIFDGVEHPRNANAIYDHASLPRTLDGTANPKIIDKSHQTVLCPDSSCPRPH